MGNDDVMRHESEGSEGNGFNPLFWRIYRTLRDIGPGEGEAGKKDDKR